MIHSLTVLNGMTSGSRDRLHRRREVRLRRTFPSVLQRQAAWVFDPLASPSSVATRKSSNKFGFSLAAPSVAWCFLLKSGLRPAARLRRLSPAKSFLGQDMEPHILLVLHKTHGFAGDPIYLLIRFKPSKRSPITSVGFFVVRTANGCKSRARPNGGKRKAKGKGVVVAQRLKEVGGKSLARRTGT